MPFLKFAFWVDSPPEINGQGLGLFVLSARLVRRTLLTSNAIT